MEGNQPLIAMINRFISIRDGTNKGFITIFTDIFGMGSFTRQNLTSTLIRLTFDRW